MAFYLNEFKKHLQSLSDKVDHPYDEPARRHLNNKTTGSLEEAYSAMKQPRMGSYQRPAPSMLNEQFSTEIGGWVVYGPDKNGQFVVKDPNGNVVFGPTDQKSATRWAATAPPFDGMPGSNRAMPKSDEINYSSLDMTAQRKTTPTPMSNMGGGGLPGGGGMP